MLPTFFHRAARHIGVGLVLFTAHADVWGGEHTVGADIKFYGTSTLHDFEGAVTSQPFVVEIQEDPGGAGAWFSTQLSLAVADLTTQHDKRDANMRKLLEAGKFTALEGTISHGVVALGDETEVTLLLTIRDREHPVSATLSEWRQTDSELEGFRLAFTVSLKAFDLKRPSVLGLIRVGDEVRVDCVVSRSAASPESPAHAAEAHGS